MALSSAPLIGVIATHYPVGMTQRTFCGAYPSYLECVTAAGGLPVIVPLGLPDSALRELYARLDGIVLTGGGDLDPNSYNSAATHETLRGIITQRDEVEFQVTRWAAEDDLPLLGICRGHQVVNAALDGSLVLDIPSQVKTDIRHDLYGVKPLDHLAHSVAIEPGTRLAQLVGATTLHVNSRHHQAVKQLGRDMIPTACAPDGIIEASEKPEARFLVTVQWHPENLLAHDDGATLALFKGLVKAAANSYSQRITG